MLQTHHERGAQRDSERTTARGSTHERDIDNPANCYKKARVAGQAWNRAMSRHRG